MGHTATDRPARRGGPPLEFRGPVFPRTVACRAWVFFGFWHVTTSADHVIYDCFTWLPDQHLPYFKLSGFS